MSRCVVRTCWTHNSVACDMAYPGHCFQIDPNVTAYVACVQEVQKSWEDMTAGASISSGAYGPALIASLAQLLCKVLHQKDVPYLATAKMQVWHLPVFALPHEFPHGCPADLHQGRLSFH